MVLAVFYSLSKFVQTPSKVEEVASSSIYRLHTCRSNQGLLTTCSLINFTFMKLVLTGVHDGSGARMLLCCVMELRFFDGGAYSEAFLLDLIHIPDQSSLWRANKSDICLHESECSTSAAVFMHTNKCHASSPSTAQGC